MSDTPPNQLNAAEITDIIHRAQRVGNEALETGDLTGAETVFSELVNMWPNNPIGLNGMGRVALGRNDLGRAEKMFRDATRQATDWSEPHSHLGNLYLSQGRYHRAIKNLEKAVFVTPTNTHDRYALASAYHRSGQFAAGETQLRAILEIDPAHAAACNDIGSIEALRNNLKHAEVLLRRAASSPDAPPSSQLNLARVLLLMKRLPESAALFSKILETAPDNIEAMIGLASAERQQNKLEDALLNAERAVSLSPQNTEAINATGNIYRELAKYQEATDAFHSALEIDPNNASARVNLAMLQLLQGDWRSGWSNYEARLKKSDFQMPWGGINFPVWHGEPLEGRTIIVLSEQGFGDSIQFARFLPRLTSMGAKVLFAVQPELAGLFKPFHPDISIIAPDQSISGVELQAMLINLPGLLGLNSPTDIGGAPYLTAPAPSDAIRRRLDARPGMKVGINWRGNPAHKEDVKRSMTADKLEALADIPGIELVNLCFGEPLPDCLSGIMDFSDLVSDFADSAALVASLDLVISVDTAVVHLAGALGIPCWAMISQVPDWRWQLGKDTTCWYDSVRLFRQPARNDWETVIKRIAVELDGVVNP